MRLTRVFLVVCFLGLNHHLNSGLSKLLALYFLCHVFGEWLVERLMRGTRCSMHLLWIINDIFVVRFFSANSALNFSALWPKCFVLTKTNQCAKYLKFPLTIRKEKWERRSRKSPFEQVAAITLVWVGTCCVVLVRPAVWSTKHTTCDTNICSCS